jgi:hypothetical protein
MPLEYLHLLVRAVATVVPATVLHHTTYQRKPIRSVTGLSAIPVGRWSTERTPTSRTRPRSWRRAWLRTAWPKTLVTPPHPPHPLHELHIVGMRACVCVCVCVCVRVRESVFVCVCVCDSTICLSGRVHLLPRVHPLTVDIFTFHAITMLYYPHRRFLRQRKHFAKRLNGREILLARLLGI